MISVQPTFQEVISDVQNGSVPHETFWINLFSETSLEEYLVKVDSSGMRGPGVHVVQKGAYKYEATIEGKTYRIRGSCGTILTDKSITISSVGCTAETVAYGDTTGRLVMVSRGFNGKKEPHELDLNAHFADISCTAFFPSGKALLTGLVDMQLKLWLMDGVSRRVFKGHTGAINQVQLLGKTGRNFLSASEDGSVRLWETGSGQQLHEFRRLLDGSDAATCITTVKTDVEADMDGDVELDGRELDFETRGVFVYVGHHSGHIRQYDIYRRRQTGFQAKSDSGITAMCYYDGYLYVGHEDGTIKRISGSRRSEVIENEKVKNEETTSNDIEYIKTVAETAISKLLVIKNKVVAVAQGIVFTVGHDLHVEQYFVGTERVASIGSYEGTMFVGGKEGIKEFQI